jgi:hypothetical protein
VGREDSIDCPLDCEYLREARLHEKPLPCDPSQVPNPDIRLTEAFLREHDDLAAYLGSVIASAALGVPETVDSDVREALEALIRTYRTLQSGVYYETRPANTLAASIFSSVQDAVQQAREEQRRELGVTKCRDAEVLGVLVFFQRLERERENGRPRGRAFIDMIRNFYSTDDGSDASEGSSLLLA